MVDKTKKNVLVLGSEGLIGSYLCQALDDAEHKPARFDVRLPNSQRYDLTGRKDRLWLGEAVKDADFVMFLAFDVGGAKYLAKKDKSVTFKTKNMEIMNNVFSCLAKHPTPFIFASSMMTELKGSSYGLLKKLGEDFTSDLGGISTRFWNVYGNEPPGIKAHAITDFLMQSIKHGDVALLTDGEEVRQYMYAGSVAWSLVQIMDEYFKDTPLEKSYDISNGSWVKTKDIARLCIEAVHPLPAAHRYKVIPGTIKDPIQLDSTIEPNLEAYKKLLGGKMCLDSSTVMRHHLTGNVHYLKACYE